MDYDEAIRLDPRDVRFFKSPGKARLADHARPDHGQMLGNRLRQVLNYPPQAQTGREEGTVDVTFQIDRSGSVVAGRVAKRSGHALLDAEALAMVSRTQPFPTPKSFADPTDFAIAIRFNLP